MELISIFEVIRIKQKIREVSETFAFGQITSPQEAQSISSILEFK